MNKIIKLFLAISITIISLNCRNQDLRDQFVGEYLFTKNTEVCCRVERINPNKPGKLIKFNLSPENIKGKILKDNKWGKQGLKIQIGTNEPLGIILDENLTFTKAEKSNDFILSYGNFKNKDTIFFKTHSIRHTYPEKDWYSTYVGTRTVDSDNSSQTLEKVTKSNINIYDEKIDTFLIDTIVFIA